MSNQNDASLQYDFVTIKSIEEQAPQPNGSRWLLTLTDVQRPHDVPLDHDLVFKPNLDVLTPNTTVQLWWIRLEDQPRGLAVVINVTQAYPEDNGVPLDIHETIAADAAAEQKTTEKLLYVREPTGKDKGTISGVLPNGLGLPENEFTKTAGRINKVEIDTVDGEDATVDGEDVWLYRLVGDPDHQYQLKMRPTHAQARPPRWFDEVLFCWTPINQQRRLVDHFCFCPHRRHEVEPPILDVRTNESVAVIKRVTSHGHEDPNQDVWSIVVKHRDSGPKRYELLFRPDEHIIYENALVRIRWLARDDETAKQLGFALRVELLGDVTYRDGK